jgi:hypothetical protein
MQIRHPREGDVLPIPLEFEHFDPAWVWLCGNAVLIGAPAHDVALLLRLVRFGEMTDQAWLRRLLRHVIKECRERGFKRYMTWLADDIEIEEKLRKICERDGAHCEPFIGNMFVGRTDHAG